MMELLLIIPLLLALIFIVRFFIFPAAHELMQDDVLQNDKVIKDIADPTESHFRNVFATISRERQEALIAHNMEKHKCSRDESMKIAIADAQKDRDLAF